MKTLVQDNSSTQDQQTSMPVALRGNVPKQDQNGGDDSDKKMRDMATISMWVSRIKHAKKYFENDFKRMRDNMDFAAGLQWDGQKKIDQKKYIANITNRAINSKVASLYAKNPTAEYQRRQRLDFALYDGHLEDLQQVVQGAMMHPQGIGSVPPQGQAMLADYAHGMAERQMIDKVGKTLEILFQYQLDEQDEEEGEFKLQAKQLVRRIITTGVGFCRVTFARDSEAMVTSSGVGNTMVNRAQQAKAILDKVQAGDINETSPQLQQLQNLFSSLSVNVQQQLQQPGVKERVVFDFIPSTSIIVDPRCRQLKGFVGARWIVQEFQLPLEDVNAIFETDIKLSSKLKQHQNGKETNSSQGNGSAEKYGITVMLWEVLDKVTKTHFFIVDGYDEFVQEPEPMPCDLPGFWDTAAVTFNDVEVEEGTNATIYPPSDVDLMKSAQQEWNRIRNELKKHRKANAPKYVTNKGMLTTDDKENLQNAESNAVVELEGVPAGTPLNQVFVACPMIPIQPTLYDTSPEMQDVGLTIGTQQENLGTVNPKGTATGQTIAEQSRMSVTSSNIDDLDDFLSTLARMAGFIMLKEMQKDTVTMIVGPGAVWPDQQQTRDMFTSQIYLTTKAASSGRPNKASDLRNWQMIAPILQQMGANPQFMVRETLRRLDDQLDPEQAFPLLPPQQSGQMPAGGQHQPGGQEQHIPGHNAPPQQNRPGPGQIRQQQMATQGKLHPGIPAPQH